MGLHEQYIFVMPGMNMVVVFQSSFTDQSEITPVGYMDRVITQVVKSSQPLPSNQKADEMLKSICSD